MTTEEALDKIEGYAYQYDKGHIESMRKGIGQILVSYAESRAKEVAMGFSWYMICQVTNGRFDREMKDKYEWYSEYINQQSNAE